jgi:hypothetical protein
MPKVCLQDAIFYKTWRCVKLHRMGSMGGVLAKALFRFVQSKLVAGQFAAIVAQTVEFASTFVNDDSNLYCCCTVYFMYFKATCVATSLQGKLQRKCTVYLHLNVSLFLRIQMSS